MMQLSHCEYCGGTTIELNSVSVSVELKKSNACDKCYHSHTQTQNHFFCSMGCFLAYMKDVSDGRTTIRWNE